ncbi:MULTISPECIES: DUF4176 domain-containing protein [Streptococcus]|uniref:DUF4176 domain-containing protein n=1 Tax=Streptococcus pantholopis TaxID=1811193 RepID=A0A172Q644_9STRE|nr:DUF4176 domain-containing protein [Streptococcus pantholopis]AND78924.1 hypothetical protein A0O21_02245 [Streptococcus pantholopis]
MAKTLLPLGSLVYLKEGTVKLMIIGRGIELNEEAGNVYTDYAGVIYPEGFNPGNGYFFNDEDIDQVVFRGYEDEEESRFMEVYEEWEKTVTIPKKKSD